MPTIANTSSSPALPPSSALADVTPTRGSATPPGTSSPTATPKPTPSPRPTASPTAEGEFLIRLHGLLLDYSPQEWGLEFDEHGRAELVHRTIGNCRILEWGASEVLGELINAPTYGNITYHIYGSRLPEDGRFVRHYLAESGWQGPETEGIPSVMVTIPYDGSGACAVRVARVLSTLHSP
jgi:hypothetical protein